MSRTLLSHAVARLMHGWVVEFGVDFDRANRIAFAGNPDGCELQCVNCSGKSSCQGRAVRL